MDDIVIRLRRFVETRHGYYDEIAEAADEIERLRQERVDWFCVAQELKDATYQDSTMVELARDNYLRVRGRYEDPRDCMLRRDND